MVRTNHLLWETTLFDILKSLKLHSRPRVVWCPRNQHHPDQTETMWGIPMWGEQWMSKKAMKHIALKESKKMAQLYNIVPFKNSTLDSTWINHNRESVINSRHWEQSFFSLSPCLLISSHFFSFICFFSLGRESDCVVSSLGGSVRRASLESWRKNRSRA